MSDEPKYTLKLKIRKKFEGIIWRIETDEDLGHIAVETRIPNSKEVNFSVFNFKTGEPLLEEIRTENGWWWNMDRIYQNRLFLHGYVSENTPEHKGICAIDVESGNMVWENYQLTLEDVSDEGIVVYNPLLQPRRFSIISPTDGSTVKSGVAEFNPVYRNITYPEFATDAALIPSYLPKNIFGPVSYLKYYNTDIWSYHIENQGSFSQEILILKEGEVVLHDILSSGIQKLNPESFFIVQNHLFYLKGGYREIVTYLL